MTMRIDSPVRERNKMTESQADGCEASASKKLKTTLEETDSSQYNILILGASYGSLLATKLLLAGHNATLICREETAALFNAEGSILRTPIRGREDDLLEICSRNLAGTLRASAPDGVDPVDYDLVVLAMQEPQYSASGVRELVGRIAVAQVPTMAITNMPLLPYLKRIPGFRADDDDIRSCFTEAALWDGFDAGLVTQCSPDPQAFRPPDEKPNVLQVRLPTNFKAARFASDHHTHILQVLEHDIEAARYASNDGKQLIQVPVKLRVHDSVFVPLAKWAMLLAGNYRCVQPYPGEMLSIRDAVCANVNASRAVYDWVVDVCIRLGGDANDFVPFEKYAKAAASLGNPSSAARALKQGAQNIERVDKLVALIAAQQGKQLDEIDATVAMVDNWLTQNRIQAQSKKQII